VTLTSMQLLDSSQTLLDLRLELAKLLEEKKRRIEFNRLAAYGPYSKQAEFHAQGAQIDVDGCERLFMAGNQQGKTWCGGNETAIHLTGRYPDWWNGAEFKKPPKFWVAGVTSESTRDNPQRVLLGPPQIESKWGTGSLPGDTIQEWKKARGVPECLDSVVVKWGGGGDVQMGQSICMFKSYEKGREKWQGDTIDGLWCDEEPPAPIYSEGRTRSQKGQLGIFTLITFTPLLGLSDVVRQFLGQGEVEAMA